MPRTRTVNSTITLRPNPGVRDSLVLLRSDLMRCAGRIDEAIPGAYALYRDAVHQNHEDRAALGDLYDDLVSDRENIHHALLPVVQELIDLLDRSIEEAKDDES